LPNPIPAREDKKGRFDLHELNASRRYGPKQVPG
jgi:hypothetical protein